MTRPVEVLGMYLHLARASQQRKRPHVRDRMLVIAGVSAVRLKLPRIAAHCRHLILEHNPAHMVRRWESLSMALDDSDFLHFLKQIQRRYPLEKAEQMLGQLGIESVGERAAYFTDEEYAAALLGTTPEQLD